MRIRNNQIREIKKKTISNYVDRQMFKEQVVLKGGLQVSNKNRQLSLTDRVLPQKVKKKDEMTQYLRDLNV